MVYANVNRARAHFLSAAWRRGSRKWKPRRYVRRIPGAITQIQPNAMYYYLDKYYNRRRDEYVDPHVRSFVRFMENR